MIGDPDKHFTCSMCLVISKSSPYEISIAPSEGGGAEEEQEIEKTFCQRCAIEILDRVRSHDHNIVVSAISIFDARLTTKYDNVCCRFLFGFPNEMFSSH